MRTPPLFLGTTLLFWGYEMKILPLGVLFFILLEARFLIKKRWNIDTEDFVKISDLCTTIFLTCLALVFLNNEPQFLLRLTAGWLPLILLPLILAQLYGTSGTIIITTRLGNKSARLYQHRITNFAHYYSAVTIFSGATAEVGTTESFVLLILLACWFLVYNRKKSYGIPIIIGLILAAGMMAVGVTKGVEAGYRELHRSMFQFWSAYYQHQYSDPFKATTALGDIGKLKLSGKIIMRVVPDNDVTPPTYLREASYQLYNKGYWFSKAKEFTPVSQPHSGQWLLKKTSTPHQSLLISTTFPRGEGLLPVPYLGVTLRDIATDRLTRNRESTIQLADCELFQEYSVKYDPAAVPDDSPLEYHLQIPKKELPHLQQVIESLHIDSASDKEKLEKIKTYFNTDFYYSLALLGKGAHATAVANFLLAKKAGHCELYATATALLLRTTGIPARYVVGYVIAEQSRLEQSYLVRTRHGHAWVEAYIDGKWQVVDTTPGNWLDAEEDEAGLFEPLADFFNYLRHRYQRFRAKGEVELSWPMLLVLGLMSAFMAGRILLRVHKKSKKKRPTPITPVEFQGTDSPFFGVLEKLEQEGFTPKAHVPLEQFIMELPEQCNSEQLQKLHNLHLQLRFDPLGLPEAKLRELTDGVSSWVDNFESHLADKTRR